MLLSRHTRRREFITLLGGAVAACPHMAGAQQADRVRRIGVLMGVAHDAEGEARVAAFRQGLQQLGWRAATSWSNIGGEAAIRLG
jgi:putative ABC transport system substrate-binding protein